MPSGPGRINEVTTCDNYLYNRASRLRPPVLGSDTVSTLYSLSKSAKGRKADLPSPLAGKHAPAFMTHPRERSHGGKDGIYGCKIIVVRLAPQ